MKRLHRSRANLLCDLVRHVNRIRGLLFLQGVAHIHPNRAGWMIALRDLRTRDGRAFPVQLMHEIEREAKLLDIVKKLLHEVDLEVAACPMRPPISKFHRRLMPTRSPIRIGQWLSNPDCRSTSCRSRISWPSSRYLSF